MVRKPTLNSIMLITYPHLNQGEWVTHLAHSQHNWTPWWVVEQRASEKYAAYMASSKKKKTKRNLSESDSENAVADLPRFIIIESLEDVYFACPHRKSNLYKD